MLLDALQAKQMNLPTVHWKIAEGAVPFLSAARSHQLTQEPTACLPAIRPNGPLIEVVSGADIVVAHHQAFMMLRPECASLLWFLLAATGSEDSWEGIVRALPAKPQMSEQLLLRDIAPMPDAVWNAISHAFRHATVASFQALSEALQAFAPNNDVLGDFAEHIVDIGVGRADHFVAVRSLDTQPSNDLQLGRLAKDMRVRIAQVVTDADWGDMIGRAASSSELDTSATVAASLRGEICEAFAMQGPLLSDDQRRKPDLILFPEVTLPHALHQERTIERLVAQTGIAALIGHVHRVLPTIAKRQAIPDTVFYVNEATLFVPSQPDDENVPEVRKYTIRKPLPTHVEYALGRAIENRNNQACQWRLISSSSLRRFVHPKWGDFSVPICSDLLRPSWWQALQGTVLHLLIPAHNQDVDLFDSLSWSRTYDIFANVVLTNHGTYGGSFGWSPKHRHHRELAGIRGRSRLAVFADVDLPVKALANEQCVAKRNAVLRDTKNLLDPVREEGGRTTFKSPPAGYRERRSSGDAK